MKLPAAGQEYSKWTVATSDVLHSFEVELGGVWYPADYIPELLGGGGAVRLLVCGPNKTPTDGAVQITAQIGSTVYPRIRCVDTPETVIRDAGWIKIVP